MKTKLRILLLFMIVSGFIFSGHAHALKFAGNAWLAHHYSYGAPTDEYFLVIEKPGLKKAQLRGFKLKNVGVKRDFSVLTSEGLTFWQIDEKRSRKLQSFLKRGSRNFDRKMKKGKLEEGTDKQVWVDNWVSQKLMNRKYRLVLWDENNKKMKAKAVYAKFENPIDENGGVPGAAPVPEPATMLLLGSGMIGLAAAGRKKIFKKK